MLRTLLILIGLVCLALAALNITGRISTGWAGAFILSTVFFWDQIQI